MFLKLAYFPLKKEYQISAGKVSADSSLTKALELLILY